MSIKDVFSNIDSPAYIIAEIGVNHNGSMELAMECIDRAAQCGADAVKFQTFKSEKLVTKTAEKADYQNKNTAQQESQLDMLKKLELSFDEFKDLKNYCLSKGIDFLSTPFDEESAEFLFSIGVDALKVSSGDMNNIPFLKKLDEYGLPIILSTGMSNLDEVKESLKAISRSPVAVLHCTSDYPAPLEDVNLLAMKTMERELQKIVGYSDHTDGIQISLAAVALGAKIIEKHFTIDKTLPGPDHKASLDASEFGKLVESIRSVERALGDGVKRCMPSEQNTKAVARKSIVLARDIKPGEVLTKEDVCIKRPGNGIEPKYFDEIIGRTVSRELHPDQLLSWDDLV